MKKKSNVGIRYIIPVALLFQTANSFSQSTAWPAPSTPNPQVGIGTSSPPARLSIVGGNSKLSGFSVNYYDVHTTIFNHPVTNAGVIQVYSGGTNASIGNGLYNLQIQPYGGNVGIGVSTNPQLRLEVSGADATGMISSFSNSNSKLYFLSKSSAASNYNPLTLVNDNGIFWSDGGAGGGLNSSSGFIIAPWTNSAAGIRIGANGNVGIGTNVPNTCKLAVEGRIAAREVKVLAGAFPDYVFSKGYKRMTLKEVEQYIQTNNHLPNIPSACEVEKENGFNLGELQLKHLEKTEELYLYVIEMYKTIESMKKENEEIMFNGLKNSISNVQAGK